MLVSARKKSRTVDLSSLPSRAVKCYRPFVLICVLSSLVIRSAFAGPFVQGVDSSEIDSELKGIVLIEELNCVACHRSDAGFAGRSKVAPRLSNIGSRLNPAYVEAYIADPHQVKPGATMPDVLAHLSKDRKAEASEAITHFLFSLKKNDFSLQPVDRVAARYGESLFRSRGCVACHSPRDGSGRETLAESSVPLGGLEAKYSVKSLVEFLGRPHITRPSGRMPDMRLPDKEKHQIAHYLLQKTTVPGHLEYTLYRGQVWEGLESDTVEAERTGHVDGFSLENFDRIQHQTAIEFSGWLTISQPGDHRFFAEMNGGSMEIDGEEVFGEKPSNRRGVKRFEGTAKLKAGKHRIEFTYFHTGREPKFSFEMEGPGIGKSEIPPSMLSVSENPVPEFKPLQVDNELAGIGRTHFSKLGCANCHNDLKIQPVPATPFAGLKPGGGCLSDNPESSVHYNLSLKQQKLIALALPGIGETELNDEQTLNKTLVTFNCIACHDRTGVGAIDPERNALFSGTREALGNQGRLPPPLSHVGAKLTPEWIAEVLLHGKRQREYLDASMPQFGEANIGHLVDLFGKVDTLEQVEIPEVSNIKESKDAGYEMIGAEGFSCIACHDFNGQRAGGPGALDIVHVTDRIQKNWFHLYMREPSRFHSTVIMPSYWPGGQSVRPEILNGDPSLQIEALWHYLKDGTRSKKPKGLSRQSNEIRVTNVAEICRGRGTAGYRGIGVGYPERVNLAFDSEEMALKLLWKGEFVNVNHGSFHPRGGGRIAFPPGIPFHRLESMDDNWPYKGKTNYTFPQDHGYQFRGYELDQKRRPTFLYRYGKISVKDFFEDKPAEDGKGRLLRTFHFENPAVGPEFYFRAASGKKATRQSDQSFQIDQLQVLIKSDHHGVLREGDSDELLIPLQLPQGRSTLTLEYRW